MGKVKSRKRKCRSEILYAEERIAAKLASVLLMMLEQRRQRWVCHSYGFMAKQRYSQAANHEDA